MSEELKNANELEHRADVKAVGTESQPTFRAFDADGPMRVYYRHLPHWRQPGATYFVTFRQVDSIPKAVLAEWFDVRQRWYRAHGLDPCRSPTHRRRGAVRESSRAVRVLAR